MLSSGSLVLLAPSNEDEGYFECTAINDVGEERRVIEVILRGICRYAKYVDTVVFILMLPLSSSPTVH